METNELDIKEETMTPTQQRLNMNIKKDINNMFIDEPPLEIIIKKRRNINRKKTTKKQRLKQYAKENKIMKKWKKEQK